LAFCLSVLGFVNPPIGEALSEGIISLTQQNEVTQKPQVVAEIEVTPAMVGAAEVLWDAYMAEHDEWSQRDFLAEMYKAMVRAKQ